MHLTSSNQQKNLFDLPKDIILLNILSFLAPHITSQKELFKLFAHLPQLRAVCKNAQRLCTVENIEHLAKYLLKHLEHKDAKLTFDIKFSRIRSNVLMHKYAHDGNTPALQKLLTSGGDVNALDEEEKTPLARIIGLGMQTTNQHIKATRMLIDYNGKAVDQKTHLTTQSSACYVEYTSGTPYQTIICIAGKNDDLAEDIAASTLEKQMPSNMLTQTVERYKLAYNEIREIAQSKNFALKFLCFCVACYLCRQLMDFYEVR